MIHAGLNRKNEQSIVRNDAQLCEAGSGEFNLN